MPSPPEAGLPSTPLTTPLPFKFPSSTRICEVLFFLFSPPCHCESFSPTPKLSSINIYWLSFVAYRTKATFFWVIHTNTLLFLHPHIHNGVSSFVSLVSFLKTTVKVFMETTQSSPQVVFDGFSSFRWWESHQKLLKVFGFFTVAVEVRCFFVRLKIFQKENANINSAHRKEKLHINVVVIGHVDSGKSTTTGHLIYKVCIHSQKKKNFTILTNFLMIIVRWYWQAYHREVREGSRWARKGFFQVCLGFGQIEGRAWAWYHHRYRSLEVRDPQVLCHCHW